MLDECGQPVSVGQLGRNIVSVKRLVSHVDVRDERDDPSVSMAVRLDAELDNREVVTLLDDRGWTSSGTWSGVTLAEIDETARVVVGPDEPRDDETGEEAEAGHWECLCETLAVQGVGIDVASLRSLPHDVVLSARLLDRIEASSNGPDPDARRLTSDPGGADHGPGGRPHLPE